MPRSMYRCRANLAAVSVPHHPQSDRRGLAVNDIIASISAKMILARATEQQICLWAVDCIVSVFAEEIFSSPPVIASFHRRRR